VDLKDDLSIAARRRATWRKIAPDHELGQETDAQAVKTAVSAYVLAERHSPYRADSHGVSIFFPTDSSSFYDPSRYDFAVGATWPGMSRLTGANFAPDDAGWGTLLTHYIQTFPGGPDVSEPPSPVSPQVPKEVFLPILIRLQ